MDDKALLLEMHEMLTKLCKYVDKIESPEYKAERDKRDFDNNVAADLYVETLERLRNNNK